MTPCWQLPRTLPDPYKLYVAAAPCGTTSAPCGACWGAPRTVAGASSGLTPALSVESSGTGQWCRDESLRALPRRCLRRATIPQNPDGSQPNFFCPQPQYHITRPLAPPYSLHTVLLKVESCNAAPGGDGSGPSRLSLRLSQQRQPFGGRALPVRGLRRDDLRARTPLRLSVSSNQRFYSHRTRHRGG